MANLEHMALRAALEWHLDAGADEALAAEPVDRTQAAPKPAPPPPAREAAASGTVTFFQSTPPSAPLGASEAAAESARVARDAATLEDLKNALAGFDGLAIRKTATNMVFCDGNPAAPVMVVGEAPGADEDRLGRPFVGVSGQLLDRIFACIGLSRTSEDPAQAVYISNILNWRPPGNRTPSPAEVEVSLPFIERHIVLARPKVIVMAGGVSAKALLNTGDGISRLRGRWHAWRPATPGIAPEDFTPIPALATFHPSYLLRTPAQKRAVWADMLMVRKKLAE